MRSRSAKRAKEDREVDDRDEFREEFETCFRCGSRDGIEVDHIYGRHHKQRHHRTNIMLLCHACHELKTGNSLPLGYWFGLKAWTDWGGVDIELLKAIRAAKNGRKDVG